MRIVTAEEINATLSIEACIPAIEDIFRAYAEGRVAPPQSLGVHNEHGTFHVKAALGDVCVIKLNANFPGNPRAYGLPTIQGLIAVFDVERGTPLAVLDSGALTTIRTAAATAIVAKYLARRDAKTLAILGNGTQGRAHIDAIKRVRPIETVIVFDTDPAKSQCASIDEAVANADIVVTCTPSRAPILDAHHLRPGLFIAGVGADNPQKHELSPALLRQSRVVADILEQAATMGDLHHAIEAGVMTRDDVAGELADVITGRVARRSDDEVFVFDSTGNALQDVAAAQLVVSARR